MIFKRVRQLLLLGALIASLSHITVASAEESVDTNKMSIVLAEAMNEINEFTLNAIKQKFPNMNIGKIEDAPKEQE